MFMSLNRRGRKALARSRHIVLHLFSGKTSVETVSSFGHRTTVLNVDVLKGRDLLDESTFSWLATLCASGRVAAVVASPPRSTYNCEKEVGVNGGGLRLRRGRTDGTRFGLASNSPEEQKAVEDESVLLFRTFVLHHLADESRDDGSLLVLEQPQDPLKYMSEDCCKDEVPSVWAWPEIRNLLEGGSPCSIARHRKFFLAEFDQGPLGHEGRKPTGVLTNSWKLFTLLHGHKGEGYREGVPERCWGNKRRQWAPGLSHRVSRAIREWIGTSDLERREVEGEERVALQALTREEEEFRKHCETDHVVFRRDCRVCLEAAMRGPRHLRQRHAHANALCLTLDLIGPWVDGKDHALTNPAKFILVGTLGVPVYKGGRPQVLQAEDDGKERKDEGERREEGDEDDGRGIGAIEDPEPLILEDPTPEGEEEEERMTPEEFANLQKEKEEEWRAIAEGLQKPVKLHNLLFTEPLASKRSAEVLRAVQRIHARISLLNLAVRRVHSDGGREFANAAFRGWCASRDIHPTYSPPSDPKANGRIEGTVGQVKAGIRALLRAQPGIGREHWPSALRQYTAQRFWMSMQTLGGPGPKRKLPPFGASVTLCPTGHPRRSPLPSGKHLGMYRGQATAPSGSSGLQVSCGASRV